MKKKSGTVSFAQIDKLIGKPSEPIVVSLPCGDDQEDTVDIEVKRILSLDEMRQFVNDVVDNLFDDEGGYHPEVEKQALALQTIRYYTNLKLDSDETGTVTQRMMARMCELMYGEHQIMTALHDVINGRQWVDIQDAIHKAVEYRNQMTAADHNAAYQQLIGRLDSATEVLGTFSEHMAGVDTNRVLDVLRRFDTTDEYEFNRAVINTLADQRMGLVE